MSRLNFEDNVESGFSQGLFCKPSAKRIKLDPDCEITSYLNTSARTVHGSQLGVSQLLEKPIGEVIKDTFANSQTPLQLVDFAALSKYRQLINETHQTPRKLPKRRDDSLNESSFDNLFGTPLRKPAKIMGAIFSSAKNKTPFERNLDEIRELASALDPVDRRIVNYDDSIVSLADEATEGPLDISFFDERDMPRRSPVRTIEVEPIPINEELFSKGLDNSKIREIELRRVEDDRRKKLAEEQMRSKTLGLQRHIKEIEDKRNRAAVATAEKDQLRLQLEGLILDIPRESESFKPLSEEAIALVRHAWTRSLSVDEVFADSGTVKIHRKDLLTLGGLNWLNDEVINFYLDLICKRSKAESDLPSAYAFQTFFYTTMCQRGYAGVKRWTRKVDVFSYNIWLVPVHLQVHWCMAVVDLEKKTIEYYDSMLGKNSEAFEMLAEYISAESMDKKKEPMSTSDWKLIRRTDIPTQQNGSDCGMFACKFAEYASRRAEVDFTQKNMPYFRQRMVYEICQQALL